MRKSSRARLSLYPPLSSLIGICQSGSPRPSSAAFFPPIIVPTCDGAEDEAVPIPPFPFSLPSAPHSSHRPQTHPSVPGSGYGDLGLGARLLAVLGTAPWYRVSAGYYKPLARTRGALGPTSIATAPAPRMWRTVSLGYTAMSPQTAIA